MPTLKALLCAALAACVLLGPASAEARFGKHSSSSSSPQDRDGGSRRDEQPRREARPRVHAATPIGQQRQDRDEDGDAPRRRRQRVVVRPSLAEVIVAGALITTLPPLRHVSPRLRVRQARYEPVPLLVRLGVQGGRMGDGGALGLSMAMEGRRLGLDARITGLALPADDSAYNAPDIDRITLLGAHLTAALWAGPRGRVRMEAGLSTAHAPDIIFVGPSLGASVETCLGRSPVDVEARIQATPFPHRQVDAQAGLALHLGAFNMRGGFRALYLNDAGHVDGVVHEEGMTGPYFGLGLAF
ncbi:MAG TPA: hypothetical protein VE153_28920 [Myxococcus sp.]|nr:hypothetical protein [Myxococcus sp.]